MLRWLEEDDFHDRYVDILGNILSCGPHAVPTFDTVKPDIAKFGGKQKVEGFLHRALLFPEGPMFDSDEPTEVLLKESKLVECSICGAAKKVAKGVDSSGFVCSPCEERRQKEGEGQKGIDEYSWRGPYSRIKRFREKQENLRKMYDGGRSWREVLDEL